MTKQKKGKGITSLCKGGILMISRGITGCGGRTEGHQMGGQCRDGMLCGRTEPELSGVKGLHESGEKIKIVVREWGR